MTRLLLVGMTLLVDLILIVATILIIVRLLGSNPSAAMTALLGGIVVGLTAAATSLANYLAGSGGDRTDNGST